MIHLFKGIFFTLVLLVGVLGVVVPTLISATNTFFVLTGFGILLGLPAFLYFIWSAEIDNLSIQINQKLEGTNILKGNFMGKLLTGVGFVIVGIIAILTVYAHTPVPFIDVTRSVVP